MKRSAIVIKFRRYTCAVCRAVYGNGQTALWLEDVNSGARIAVATVALDVPLPKDRVLIKNWEENEGILQALTDAGIVVPTGIKHPTGFVEADECLLLI